MNRRNIFYQYSEKFIWSWDFYKLKKKNQKERKIKNRFIDGRK